VYVAATRSPSQPAAVEAEAPPAAAPRIERPAVVEDAPPPEPEPEPIADEPEAPGPAPTPRRTPRTRGTPEDLLRIANERRRDKQWRAADALYRDVIASKGAGHSVYVATLASAQIHLDHLDDAVGALRLYRRAVRALPRGPLAQEARWGVAESQRALGNRGDEREALETFLEHHADSHLAARARARLAELAATER
jgi:hypothetical protein